MTDDDERDVHALIADAAAGNQVAVVALEERVRAFERMHAHEDTIYVLDRLLLLGMTEIRERLLALPGIAPRGDDRPVWLG